MRMWISCCRYFESIGSIWVVPLLLSLAVSLALCVAIGTETTILPITVLLNLSRDMLNLLGVIAAILIAVITTMYVLSEQSRREGFRSFLSALNGLRRMPGEIQSNSNAIDPDNDGPAARLAIALDEFVERMNEIKPTWQGYDASPGLNKEMIRYIGGIRGGLATIYSDLESRGLDTTLVGQLDRRIDESGRGMLVGLLSMESGIVGKRFVERLLKLSLSLTCLLVLSLSVRALAEPLTAVAFRSVGLAQSISIHISGCCCCNSCRRIRLRSRFVVEESAVH